MDNYNNTESYFNYLQDIRIDNVSPKAGAISPNENEGGSVEHDDNACLHESHDPFVYDPGGARMYCTLLKEK